MMLPRLFLLLLAPFASIASNADYPTPSVNVYDNVLPEKTRQTLYKACEEESNKGNHVFNFPLEDPHAYPIIEQIVNNLLWKIYPDATSNTYNVEYWSRQNWYHILAHADMDEGLRKEHEEQGTTDAPFAHPAIGHVLYLQLGSKVQGPTCVWVNTTFGESLIEDETTTDMIVVPAVESRLLRFQGHLLHAVPRPADLWLHPTRETEQGPDYERMVLLFNLWPTTMLHGRNVSEATFDAAHLTSEQSAERSCNAHKEWKKVSVQDVTSSVDDEMVLIQFPLMGDERRRGTAALSAMMETASNAAHQAFVEPYQPTRIVVQPLQKKKKSWLNSFIGIEF